MNKTFFKDYDRVLPLFIVLLTGLYLLIVLSLSYAIDIQFSKVFGIHEWLLANYEDYPIFWVQMFKEASPTEYIQWVFIFLLFSLSLVLLVKTRKDKSISFWPWLLLSGGFMIMFLEDVFNLRHFINNIIAASLNIAWADFIYDPRRSYIELAVYVVLAVIMVVAFVLIIKEQKLSLRGKKYLLVGYLIYGLAGFASASRHLGGWYTRTGQAILLRIYPEDLLYMIERNPDYGHMFMDYLVEESLELLGGSFLLAAMVVFFTSRIRRVDGDV